MVFASSRINSTSLGASGIGSTYRRISPNFTFLSPRQSWQITKNEKHKPLLSVQSSETGTEAGDPVLEIVASPTEREIDYSRAIILFLIPALGGLLFGYDIGATSGAIDSITDPIKSGTDWYNLKSIEEGLVVSTSLLGGMIGSILAASYGDKVGRKSELLISSVLYGIGIVSASLANSYAMLCIGRLIYGVGIGGAMHGGPSYIAETSPTSLRGTFISLKEALIVCGILLGYLFSFIFVDRVGGWRWNYGVAIPVIVLFGVGMTMLPESPRHLVLKGEFEKARMAMRSVCGKIADVNSVVGEEVEVMQSVRVDDSVTDGQKLFRRTNWRPLYITLSLVVFQQATGQPSVLYYAQEIFEKTKIFSDSSSASAAAIVLGTWKLVTTVVAASRVESLGRRPLLLYGVRFLALSGVVESARGVGAAWTGVFALLLYVGSYQFSFGPIVWLLVGELYPLKARTQGVALCTFTNFGVNFVVSLLFPVLNDLIGLSAEYILFAAIGVGSVASIYYSVPETKGKTLEEIETMMSS